MNLDPYYRFQEPAKYLRNEVSAAFKTILNEVPYAVKVVFDMTYWTWRLTHYEYYMEIKGMVDAVNDPVVTLPGTILINSYYELASWCTSIIA